MLMVRGGRTNAVSVLTAVVFSMLLVSLPLAGEMSAAPTQTASVFVAPNGSDAALCTSAAPCRNLDRAYAVARPGTTVSIAGGSYPAQTITWRPGRDSARQIVFRPAGKVTIQGDLKIYASGVHIAGQATGTITRWRERRYSITVAGDIAVLGDSAVQHPRNVTVEGIDGGSLGTYTAENVVVRDIDAGPLLLSAPCYRAESKIGPNVDAEIFTPRNITWERVVVHGMDYDETARAAGCHFGGLFIVSAQNVTIRESVFTENMVYNIQVQNYVGSPAINVTIQNSWFGCPVLSSFEAATKTCNGQSSIQFNAFSLFSNWLIRYNSFAGSGAAGANAGQATFSNVRFVANAGRPPAPDVCGRSGVTFSRNAWVSARCGSTDRSIGDPFVSVAAGREDLSLLRKTPARGLVDGVGDHALRTDIKGGMRPLRFPRDAGSIQYESAEIKRWDAIGAAKLGALRAEIRTVYGRPRRAVRDGIRTDSYRLRDGRLWVRYAEDRVVEISTTSGYYTTSSGLGPGSRLATATRHLRARWDECRAVYRRRFGGTVVYLRPDRARRSVVGISLLRRSAEQECSNER